ncbi:MAG TPA: hypothetical protein VMM13_15890 [Euzebya sp.]|nr:hypothetical protein [Euzebya sp.]
MGGRRSATPAATADPDGWRLPSSAHGALRHLLLCFPLEAARTPGYRRVYADLFAQLPSAVHLTILAHADAEGDLHGMLASAGRSGTTTVIPGPPDLDFSVWAQDPFLAVDGGPAGPILLQPSSFQRRGDDGIAAVLHRKQGLRLHRTAASFEGGNILVGDEFVLVGRDGTRRIEELSGDRRVVVVGTDLPVPPETMRPVAGGDGRVELVHAGASPSQPLGHIDMFVSLAGRGDSGRYRLLVGSPDMADEILGRPPLPDALGPLFDDVADRLAAEGFEVIRNPLPLTYGDGRRAIDGVPHDVRIWYFASANNCLVQIDPMEGNHVWLPTYGHRGWQELAATDQANRQIWEGLGFTVHPLGSFHAFAQRHGALRCIVKTLQRAPAG